MQHTPCGCQACGCNKPPEGCVHPSPPRPPRPPAPPWPPRPPRPPKPPATQGVLLDKIVACERKRIPCHEMTLQLEGLPCCVQPPITLVMVQQSGAPAWWTPLENKGPYAQLCLRIMIPVCCQVKDACGCHYAATSVVEVDTCLSPSCPPSDWWRYKIVIVPCVRLCCGPVVSQDACFQAQLEVAMEVYLTRPEPCMMRAAEPPCPDLPLYPQPCKPTPPCWQQCPEAPDPCGWPRQG